MSIMKVRVKIVNDAKEYANIMEIRRRVFQLEQGVDPTVDFDGQDKEAHHFIAHCNCVSAGTARVRYCTDRQASAKIERVAVLPEFRGCGAGKLIMEYILDFLKGRWLDKAELNAQKHIKDFYEKVGFQQIGEPFDKNGVLHVKMEIVLYK